MAAAPNTDLLDEHMKDVIVAVKRAVGTAIPHIKDDPKVVDKAIADCKEILDTVMEGNVKEWFS
jgi:hypothetical protein